MKFVCVYVDYDFGSLEGIKFLIFNEINVVVLDMVKICEYGIWYEVDFMEGYKMGFFCD